MWPHLARRRGRCGRSPGRLFVYEVWLSGLPCLVHQRESACPWPAVPGGRGTEVSVNQTSHSARRAQGTAVARTAADLAALSRMTGADFKRLLPASLIALELPFVAVLPKVGGTINDCCDGSAATMFGAERKGPRLLDVQIGGRCHEVTLAGNEADADNVVRRPKIAESVGVGIAGGCGAKRVQVRVEQGRRTSRRSPSLLTSRASMLGVAIPVVVTRRIGGPRRRARARPAGARHGSPSRRGRRRHASRPRSGARTS